MIIRKLVYLRDGEDELYRRETVGQLPKLSCVLCEQDSAFYFLLLKLDGANNIFEFISNPSYFHGSGIFFVYFFQRN